MMGRLDRDQGQLFYEFSLDEMIPSDHLLRRINVLATVLADFAPPSKGVLRRHRSALGGSRADDPDAPYVTGTRALLSIPQREARTQPRSTNS